VFVDGWTLEAAEAICANPEGDVAEAGGLDAYAVFDALNRLVDHSLVHAIDTEHGVRFGILETIRQYAVRLLAEDDRDRIESRDRHRRHFPEWATSLGPTLLAFESDAALRCIEQERSNLLAAARTASIAVRSIWSSAGSMRSRW
jgi:predicted ATPase